MESDYLEYGHPRRLVNKEMLANIVFAIEVYVVRQNWFLMFLLFLFNCAHIINISYNYNSIK